MSDPFRPNVNKQLMHEARIGLTILCCLISVLVYIAYYKMSGKGTKLPDHVVNAPLATMVWPGENPSPDRAQSNPISEIAKRLQPATNRDRESIARQVPKQVAPQSSALANEPQRATDQPESSSQQLTANQSPTIDRAPRLFQRPNQFKPQTNQPESVAQNPLPPIGKPIHPKLIVNGKSSNDVAATNQSSNSSIDFNSLRNSKVIDDPFVQQASVEFPAPKTGPEKSELPPHRTTGDKDPHEILPLIEENSFKPKSPSQSFVPKQDNVSQAVTELDKKPFDNPATEQLQSQDKLTSLPSANDSNGFKPLSMRPATLQEIQTAAVQPGQQMPQTQTNNPASPPKPDDYVVRSGDDFWSISKDAYGDPRYFRALFAHNQQLYQSDFEVLTPGTTISVPPKEELSKNWASHCPPDLIEKSDVEKPDTYTTKAGQTLYGIAREELGQASLYVDLLNLNRTRLPNGTNSNSPLPAGIKLVLKRN